MKTMIKRILAACWLFVIISALCSCQLAKEESGSAGEDRLIGVLVTAEYLDLFDMEAYMNDNLGSGFKGGEIAVDSNNAINGGYEKYGGRIYATPSADAPAEGETGKAPESLEYVFEGVAGIRYFAVKIPATETMGTHRASFSDDGISDGHVAVNVGDDGEGVVLEGTIYVAPASGGLRFYFNPVYQDADGKVYVISGSWIGSSGDRVEGAAFSQSLKASYTTTENGKQTTDELSVTVSVATIFAPEKIVILQIGDDHSIIAQADYAPASVPDTITPQSGTSYIVMESYSTNAYGKTQVTRVLYDKSATYIRSYHCREDGICVAKDTPIDW